jgi:hypothetical protein
MSSFIRPRRPTSVVVLAVFHFILGGLGLCFGLFGIVGALIVYLTPPPPAPPPGAPVVVTAASQNQFMDSRVPYWKEIGLTFNMVDLLISAGMIAAGVGLLQMKAWARTASLAYGGVSIVDQAVHIVYTAVYIVPAVQAFYDALGASAGSPFPPGMISMMKAVVGATVWLSVIGFIYPVVVLIVLLRPSVAEAFRAGPPGPGDYSDRYGQGRLGIDEAGVKEGQTGYGDLPPGYEPDDRIGPAPQ